MEDVDVGEPVKYKDDQRWSGQKKGVRIHLAEVRRRCRSGIVSNYSQLMICVYSTEKEKTYTRNFLITIEFLKKFE